MTIRPLLRKLLHELLRTDTDLEAFCSDYFPSERARFTLGMDRNHKLTILLDYADAATVLDALRKEFPEAASKIDDIMAGVHAVKDADCKGAIATVGKAVTRTGAARAQPEVMGAKAFVPRAASDYVISEQDIYETLRLSRFSSALPSTCRQWAREQILMQTPAVHSNNGQCFRALLVCWLLLEIERAVSPDAYVGWIEEDAVHNAIKVLIGLKAASISAADKLEQLASDGITNAVKFTWLHADEYDAWRPGMVSGTGMTSRLSVTPLGRKVLTVAGVTELPANNDIDDSSVGETPDDIPF